MLLGLAGVVFLFNVMERAYSSSNNSVKKSTPQGFIAPEHDKVSPGFIAPEHDRVTLNTGGAGGQKLSNAFDDPVSRNFETTAADDFLDEGDPAGNLGSYKPTKSGALHDGRFWKNGAGELTIKNGTTHNAIVKLIDSDLDAKVWSIVVLAKEEFVLREISDGSYRLLFAFGDEIITDSDRFAAPTNYSAFDDKFQFETIRVSAGVHYSTYTITLHPVRGGRAETKRIDSKDFERY